MLCSFLQLQLASRNVQKSCIRKFFRQYEIPMANNTEQTVARLPFKSPRRSNSFDQKRYLLTSSFHASNFQDTCVSTQIIAIQILQSFRVICSWNCSTVTRLTLSQLRKTQPNKLCSSTSIRLSLLWLLRELTPNRQTWRSRVSSSRTGLVPFPCTRGSSWEDGRTRTPPRRRASLPSTHPIGWCWSSETHSSSVISALNALVQIRCRGCRHVSGLLHLLLPLPVSHSLSAFRANPIDRPSSLRWRDIALLLTAGHPAVCQFSFQPCHLLAGNGLSPGNWFLPSGKKEGKKKRRKKKGGTSAYFAKRSFANGRNYFLFSRSVDGIIGEKRRNVERDFVIEMQASYARGGRGFWRNLRRMFVVV